MSKLCLCSLLFGVLYSVAVQSQSWAQPVENDSFLLPALEEIAHKDGDRIFSICEIYKGESRTAIIRPNIRCHNAYSVAKLFTVIALGIMEDKGIIDIDEPVFPILKSHFPEKYDPKWEKVKISDVIRHRVGFSKAGLLDIDADDSSTWPRNFLLSVLSEKLEYEPGEKYVYTDAAFYIASYVVYEKTGQKLNEFLIKELFEPLKFKEYAFSTDPDGIPIGATGLYISVDDMAKLGEMLVNDGQYKGCRILSERFVNEAFSRTFELYPLDSEGSAFGKGGMNGQLLYLNRRTKRVVAIFSYLGDVDSIRKYLLENDK